MLPVCLRSRKLYIINGNQMTATCLHWLKFKRHEIPHRGKIKTVRWAQKQPLLLRHHDLKENDDSWGEGNAEE